MIYNKNGFPKPAGASDWMDSAHAAGMIVYYGLPGFDHKKIREYVLASNEAVRCPYDNSNLDPSNPKNFTRDQLVQLATGLSVNDKDLVKVLYDEAVKRNYRAQNTEADVPGSVKKFPNGADLLTPSVMNHLRLCSGQKPKLLGKIWLMIDIAFNGVFSPMSEPNNMISMSLFAGDFYVKFMKLTNPKLKDAIIEYWCGWRAEPELAQLIIKRLAL